MSQTHLWWYDWGTKVKKNIYNIKHVKMKIWKRRAADSLNFHSVPFPNRMLNSWDKNLIIILISFWSERPIQHRKRERELPVPVAVERAPSAAAVSPAEGRPCSFARSGLPVAAPLDRSVDWSSSATGAPSLPETLRYLKEEGRAVTGSGFSINCNWNNLEAGIW